MYEIPEGLNLALRKNGAPIPSIVNCKEILANDPALKGKIAFDEFSLGVVKLDGYPLSEPGEWSDIDTTKLMIWMSERYGFAMAEGTMTRIIDVVADGNRFHPVRDYLKSLVWDNVKRVDTWLNYYFGAAECESTSIFERVFMVGAIGRIIQPGCKNDNVLILEGKQGIGKSTGLQNLFGKDWFSDAPLDIGNGRRSDGYQLMNGHWGIELAELAELDRNRKRANELKAFFSQLRDEYRPPYGRLMINVPRQCVFIGTVNNSDYLSDSTGNRRFMPVEVFYVKTDELARDRDQLWAEAYQMYLNGEKWWFASDNEAIMETQESRYNADPWEDHISSYIDSLPFGTNRIHSDMLYSSIGIDIASIRNSDFARIKTAMEHLGWKSARPYIDGIQRRGFVRRVPITVDSQNPLFVPESEDMF